MNPESLRHQVLRVMSNVLGVSVHDIDDNSSNDTITSWDSVRHIDLVMSLEEEFDIEIETEQMLDMMNAKLVILIVEELLYSK